MRIKAHRLFIVALVAVVAGDSSSLVAQRTAPAPWTQRPEIIAVQKVFQDVELGIRTGRFFPSDTLVECENGSEWQIRMFKDSTGGVRRLVVTWAGEDHGEVNSYTYDSLGRSRFALSEQAAVNGSEAEIRIYWNESGEVVRKTTKRLKGPGYPWGDVNEISSPAGEPELVCHLTFGKSEE